MLEGAELAGAEMCGRVARSVYHYLLFQDQHGAKKRSKDIEISLADEQVEEVAGKAIGENLSANSTDGPNTYACAGRRSCRHIDPVKATGNPHAAYVRNQQLD